MVSVQVCAPTTLAVTPHCMSPCVPSRCLAVPQLRCPVKSASTKSLVATPRSAAVVTAVCPLQRAGVAPTSQGARKLPLLTPQDLASMPIAIQGLTKKTGVDGNRRRILCFGDSLTAGYCSAGKLFEPYGRSMAESLGAAGIPVEVVISGHSGRTAQEMVAAAEGTIVDVVGCQGKGLARILKEDGKFDLAIIMAGTNDMGHGLQQSQILEDLRALHALCHQYGVPTAALAPPPAPGLNQAREAQRLQLVTALQELCGTMPGVLVCVDPAELVPAASAGLWERDGLHFTPAGSQTLGQRLTAMAAGQLSAARLDTVKQGLATKAARPLSVAPAVPRRPLAIRTRCAVTAHKTLRKHRHSTGMLLPSAPLSRGVRRLSVC